MYEKARTGAAVKKDHPVPLVAIGERSDADKARFKVLKLSRGHNVVEPLFVPRQRGLVYHIKHSYEPSGSRVQCLSADLPKGIGDTPRLMLSQSCRGAETEKWLWQPGYTGPGKAEVTNRNVMGTGLGYVRPALTRNMGGGMWGRVMCLSSQPWHTKPSWDHVPMMLVCNAAVCICFIPDVCC